MKAQKNYLKNGMVLVFIFLIVPTLQAEETPPLTSLVINEIMYHPVDNESDREWIEVYNPTISAIDLNGWTITDGQEEDNLMGDQLHGDGTTLLLPGTYGLITGQGAQVYNQFIIPEGTIRLLVDDTMLFGHGLNDKTEKLLLKDQLGVIVDAVEWGANFPDVPGSPSPGVGEGHSLNRRLNIDTDNTRNDFYESSAPTPGAENNITESFDQVAVNESENRATANATTLVITQLYYHTYSSMNNEFFTVYNPTNITMNISGWYLTDEPWKDAAHQSKLIFPIPTIIPPMMSITVTQNATAYEKETANLPDFEYKVNSRIDVPQMRCVKTVTLSNTGGLVALKNTTNTTIDLLMYGNCTRMCDEWTGPPIPQVSAGIILTRVDIDGMPQDADTASDWIHPRIYRIGQSDFPANTIAFNGEITLFVSPDNSYTTIVHMLQSAQRTIDVNLYEFTSPDLYSELVHALERNVTIRLFMEGSPIGGLDDREKYILSDIVSHGGFVRFLVSDAANHVTARYQFDHAKYLIIDNETVVVESSNWAKTGVPKNPTYGNREWGMILRNAEVAASFEHVFQDDWDPHHGDSYLLQTMNLSIPLGFSLDQITPRGSYTPLFSAKTIQGSFVAQPIFSPDSSEYAILQAIQSAHTTIYIQQLYIYRDWGDSISPFVEQLAVKAQQGVTVKIILDYNPEYEQTTAILNETKSYLEAYGAEVKFLTPKQSSFETVHNKGMIIDNTTVLVSSINWNEQSVRENREAGVLLENKEAATYYASVFLSDWNRDAHAASSPGSPWTEYKYYLLVALVFSITCVLIARDWRKRKWR